MKRKILSVTANVFFALLNLLLIVLSAFVPFYYSVIALTKPETVTTIIQNVDYKTLVKNTPEIRDSLKEYGIDYEEADRIMKSKQTGELIELYADEATEILLSIPENRKFSVSLIKQLVNKNLDTVLNITEENTDIKFNRKIVKSEVNKYMNANERVLKAYTPVLEQARTVVKQIRLSKLVERSLSLQFIILFTAVITMLIIAICLLKRRNFKSFLFLGIDFAVISIILGSVILFCKTGFITSLALQMSDFGVSIIESAVSVCTEKIIGVLIISVMFTVLFFSFFTTARCAVGKKTVTDNPAEVLDAAACTNQ